MVLFECYHFAKVLCWIGIIASVIAGAIMIAGGVSMGSSRYGYSSAGATAVGGVLTIIIGCLFSWIGSFFMYGFGRLIENTEVLRKNVENKE